jgi:hypothetical protein
MWLELPALGHWKWALLVVVACLWLDPRWWCMTLIPGFGTSQAQATPLDTLTLLSLQCYALIGLFVLGLIFLRPQAAPLASGRWAAPQGGGLGAATP